MKKILNAKDKYTIKIIINEIDNDENYKRIIGENL